MQSSVALLLIPMAILASDGPSTGESGNYGAYESPDLEVPWSQRQYSSEGKDQNKERDPPSPEPMDLKLISIYENANVNSASDREFKQMMSLQPATDWDGKPSVAQAKWLVSRRSDQRSSGGPKIKAEYFQTCPTSTSPSVSIATTPRSTPTTPDSRSSIFCLPDPTPFRPATPKSPAPTMIPTTSASPPPPTSLPTASKVKPSKCRKKSKLLTPKTAKIVLEIILATKQHALSVLKTLNYLEMEVLSQSADDCPLPDFQLSHFVPKKMPQRLEKPLKPSSWTHSQAFFFGIRPASHRESVSDLAVAREEELKLKRRVWEEHKQEMRAMQSSKPRRFQIAPSAAVRLEAVKEPQVPQEPLEPPKPLKLPPNQDTSDAADTWNPAYLPKAETNAIREENTP